MGVTGMFSGLERLVSGEFSRVGRSVPMPLGDLPGLREIVGVMRAEQRPELSGRARRCISKSWRFDISSGWSIDPAGNGSV
jgi:hypothetical protein